MQYDLKITFGLNEQFDINHVNRIYNQYRDYNYRILVEVQNTKDISSYQIRQLPPNVLIRIAGGYDADRIAKYKGQLFGRETTTVYYYDSVIYTRNEAIKILEEIEKIESGIKNEWSDIQKVVYVYDKLKRQIMYDPKYERKSSKEVRSLRGLITKKTVCAGYALIFKELMDRHNIKCEFARGGTKNGETSGHAWNIITIDGKKYPIDLTLDNTQFRSGRFDTFQFLGQDVKAFSQEHYPHPNELTQNYRQTLSQLDPNLIKKIYSQINRTIDYSTTTYNCTRSDGSRFVIAQVGNIPTSNGDYYRYYYYEILSGGIKGTPRIFYGTENITELVDKKNFNRYVEQNYEDAVGNVLFSKRNISDTILKNSNYIGGLERSIYGNYYDVVKPEEHIKAFSYPTKTFRRSNGSMFIAQKIPALINVNGINIMKYHIFEMVKENGEEYLKCNTVFTEKDFFLDNRQSLVDDFLSRERLDRKARDAGSYIGYYNNTGTRIYNPDLVNFFETSKRIDINPPLPKKPTIKLPSFYELEFLASTYEIFYVGNEMKVRNINTGEVQNNETIITKAIFANIWLSSAGLKPTPGDARFGEAYAFSSSSHKLYDVICKKLLESCKKNNVIDSVELYRFIYEHSYLYNDGEKIVVNLFKTLSQTSEINKIFSQAVGIDVNTTSKTPSVLYSNDYAYNLAYQSYGHSSRRI